MERWHDEKMAQRQARQTWTATGKTRKETAPVHAPLKPLKPIAKPGQLPSLPLTDMKDKNPLPIKGMPQRYLHMSTEWSTLRIGEAFGPCSNARTPAK